MGDGDVVDSGRGRRDARWMMMWPFSGVASGLCASTLALVSVLYVFLQPDGDAPTISAPYASRVLTFGLMYALSGAACGLLVGLVLTFVVGDRQGARRARLVGGTTYAFAGVVFGLLVGGGGGYFLLLVVTSVRVGLVAGRWHDRLASRPRVEDFYAH
jgi:MFS family permease